MKKHTIRPLKHELLTTALATALCLGLSAPLLAAESSTNGKKIPQPSAEPTAANNKCMSDLREFQSMMQEDGHWLGSGVTGYGYPISNQTVEISAEKKKDKASKTENSANYWRARPSYEIHTLLSAASILAQRDQQANCQALLNTTRDIYTHNKPSLDNNKMVMTDMSAHQAQQIASAQSVTSKDASFRSNQLIGTNVVNQANEDLGNVNDIIMSPNTGKIVYLVIGRGGFFGINEKHVPVPWTYFKITADSDLLVLDTNKDTLDDAPQIDNDELSKEGGFATESNRIDAYWKMPQS